MFPFSVDWQSQSWDDHLHINIYPYQPWLVFVQDVTVYLGVRGKWPFLLSSICLSFYRTNFILHLNTEHCSLYFFFCSACWVLNEAPCITFKQFSNMLSCLLLAAEQSCRILLEIHKGTVQLWGRIAFGDYLFPRFPTQVQGFKWIYKASLHI